MRFLLATVVRAAIVHRHRHPAPEGSYRVPHIVGTAQDAHRFPAVASCYRYQKLLYNEYYTPQAITRNWNILLLSVTRTMADQPDYDAITWPVQLTSKVHRKNNPLLDPRNPALSGAGKTVLITGATGGIGLAIAEAWVTAGGKAIVITGRNEKKLREVVEKLDAIGQDETMVHSFGPVDITKEEDVAALWKKAGEAVGRIDVLVNNAGSLTQAMIGKCEPGKWWQDFVRLPSFSEAPP